MKIHEAQLRPADIVVSTTGAAVSRAIRAGTGASVSHSMLYIGGSMVIEAIDKGVVKRTYREATREATLAIALRRRGLKPEQAAEVKRHAEAFAARGLPYDEIGAIGSGTTTNRGRLLAAVGCQISLVACGAGAAAISRNAEPGRADQAFFCSELVARVFELAGAPIVAGSPSYATPRHVRVSNQLLYIGHLIDVIAAESDAANKA